MTSKLYRQGLLLEYFTVGYNLLEAILSIALGRAGNSMALIGFGLDSVVESLSGLVLIWRLQQHGTLTPQEEIRIESRATKFVAITFLVLAAYIAYESAAQLITREIAQPSLAGIVIAIASLVLMPFLAWQKYRVGRALGSSALVADSKETLACSWLSLTLLLGLAGNYVFGFWQADALASWAIVFFLVREGTETWREAVDD